MSLFNLFNNKNNDIKKFILSEIRFLIIYLEYKRITISFKLKNIIIDNLTN